MTLLDSNLSLTRPFSPNLQYQKHGPLRDIQLDDIADFAMTDKALRDMGVTDQERLEIYTLIAGILHLGIHPSAFIIYLLLRSITNKSGTWNEKLEIH